MDSSLSHMISWSESTRGDIPVPLTGPSVTISPLPSPHQPTVFLYGGKQVHDRRLSDIMWSMDLSTRIWTRLDAGDGPGPRYFHSMDVWEDKLVCFGGMSSAESTVHSDIWFFDCLTRKWLPQPEEEQDEDLLPSPRYAHLSAVSRGKLIVSGGQHSDNSWIYEVNVYDLRTRRWISKTAQPEMSGLHSKGAYRSVMASSKQKVILPRRIDNKPSTTHSYTIDEEGEGGDIWCYSNYDFARVRRELDLFTPIESDTLPFTSAEKHISPPTFNIRDISSRMRGTSQPPGLRFPTGGIVGNHFVLCGLYLASTSAAFSIWALNLEEMTWKHLEPSVLIDGSWNKAILWPEKNRLIVFGNANYDLATDYGKRAVNLDHLAIISLETFGIYTPPKLQLPTLTQETGLSLLEEQLVSDFEVVCEDGRKIKCSKRLLRERWSWFAQQENQMLEKTSSVVEELQSVDINDTLLGSYSPAQLEPSQINMPQPFPVCVAFLQYLYTLTISTQLQNRAPVLSALLFMAKQYQLERLGKLVVHALHERLDPTNAVGVYEVASLSGELPLQVRALQMIHSAKSNTGSRSGRQGPQSATTTEG
ncbi:hypothetical protein TREMEDRAFT_11835, partial [Tremella mesenterica DSM 1558]|uniref:uncharacterized protein n=1 Tax=Tremella mesenterica (strain ATCC 24925 / CBS 8224 / DSM 1558 / NBRC 9311 / NRRL Y-6157 / RJB 2259-6 / UBC 559-6) TaxID=578456 RepID=UPI0003F49840